MAALTLPRKELFDLPEGVIYLDGNSLGPLPVGVAERLQGAVRDEWGAQLIGGWNESDWISLPRRIGDRIARLIGAPDRSVIMGDTLSIKIYQALAAALAMRKDRRIVLSDNGNFPTDLYMAEGLLRTIDAGHVLKTPDPEEVEQQITSDVAVVMLTEVDYSTGRKHDMKRITGRAQEAGAVLIWDLAHSAGAVPVDLEASNAEFAVGCTYKFLNGGPGAPAFIYVRPDIAGQAEPALAGWMGHAAPFAFDSTYRPATSVERMRVGTPPVLHLSALEAALDVWNGVDMAELRRRSLALSDLFIEEVEARCPQLKLRTPRDHALRGSQVSFGFEHGYAAMRALIARGVIGDFRAPDTMRFGITPLYLDEADMVAAAGILEIILRDQIWREPQYQVRARVT